MEGKAGSPSYQALPSKDDVGGNPQEKDEERQKQRDFLEALEDELEQMPQSPISEAALHEVHSAGILGQLTLNLLGMVLFCCGAFWVQITYMPRHVCIMLLTEGLIFIVSFIVLGILGQLLASLFLPNRTWGTWKDSSGLLNALCGWQNLILRSKFELYALTHAINKGVYGLRIDMVRTDNPAIAPKVFTTGNPPQEVEPALFWARKILTRDGERDLLHQYHDAPALSCNFFDDELVKLRTSKHFPCTVKLQRRNYWRDLLLQPIVCMVVSVAIAVVMLTPMTYWAYRIFDLHRAVCQKEGKYHHDLRHLETVLAFEGEELAELCSQFVSFAQAVHKDLHVADVELILTCVLAVVMQVVSAVYRETTLNDRTLLKFVHLKPDTTMREKLELKAQVDCVSRILQPLLVLQRLGRLLFSLMERPRVCFPLEKLDRTTDYNKSFKIIMKPVLQAMDGEDVIEQWSLPPCEEERPKSERPKSRRKWSEKAQVAKAIWEEKRVGLGLNRFGTEGCRLAVVVPITCAESLELFKKEFLQKSRTQGGYQEQLEEIFATERAQETFDQSVTLSEPLRMGPLVVPPGFALTHVSVELPEGGLSSAVVGRMGEGEKHLVNERYRIDSKEKFEKLLNYGEDDKDSTKQIVRLNGFSAHFESLVILRFADSDTRMSDLVKLYGDDAVYAFFFVFQLAHPDPKRASPAAPEKDPLRRPFEDMEKWAELVPSSKTETTYERFKAMHISDYWSSLFFAIRKPSRQEVVTRMKILFADNLVGLILLALGCVAIVLVIPVLRLFRGHVVFFPEPLAMPLMQNAMVQFLALFFFMAFFLLETRRLSLIDAVLSEFEKRTLRPRNTRIQSKDEDSEARLKLDPFALVLWQNEEYNPSDKASMANWRNWWTNVGENVENWNKCQSTLRVLVSTSRLTSQALIVLAFVVLGALFISSFIQALNGQGAVAVDGSALREQVNHGLHAKLRAGMSSGSAAIRSAVDGISSGAAAAVGKAGAAAGARRLMEAAHGGQEVDALTAAEDLRRAVAPFHQSLHLPVTWQLEELEAEQRRLSALDHAGTYLAAVQAVKLERISKTQVLSLALLAPLLFLSSRLVLKMARVNEAFDRHESLLVEQKTQHRHLQTGREANPASGETERVVRGSLGGPEAEAEVTKDKGLIKDTALRRYEKMLDVAIEASRNGRRQYPLKLFGYVINYALLGFWIAGLGWPLLRQLQGVLPHVVESGCTWVEDYALTGLQGRLDDATHFTNDAFQGAKSGQDAMVPHITLKELFHNSICLPLVNALEGQLRQLETKTKALSGAGPAGPGQSGPGPGPGPASSPAGNSSAARRRLALLHSAESTERKHLAGLPLVIQRWWAAHGTLEPRVKLALAQLQLQGLRRSALRLLQEAPQAVVDAYVARGLPAALALARKQRDEEATEPSPSLSLALEAVHVV